MPRLYCPSPLSEGAIFALPDTVARHVQVLRLDVGDSLTLFNGEGGEYTATLTELSKRSVWVEVKTFSPREVELPYAITLAQGLPEGSKMDWIIEKAVELGVSTIQPLSARRSVVKLSGERIEKRLQHWTAIIAAASEQCGRNRLAHVSAPSDPEAWFTRQDLHKRILLSPRAEQSLSDWARHHPPQALSIAVGPEGGFSDEEEMFAARHGALLLGLGPRVLRTETAGLAALAALNACWGEI